MGKLLFFCFLLNLPGLALGENIKKPPVPDDLGVVMPDENG
jgi:hypothetical protein